MQGFDFSQETPLDKLDICNKYKSLLLLLFARIKNLDSECKTTNKPWPVVIPTLYKY